MTKMTSWIWHAHGVCTKVGRLRKQTPRKNVCAWVNFTEIGLMNRVFRACLFRNMAVKRSTSHMCLWSKIIR